MSAISNFLTFLRSAIYAIDVRDGIADAIEQCYNDVNNPTLKTEALEAALQTKIDEGEMAALTIGDGTITAAKLASGVIDNTLATSGAAADAKKTGDEIAAVKADLADVGMPSTAKAALLACFRNVAWINENGQDCYSTLETALGMSAYPKIVATFNPGVNIIYTDDTLDTLKQYMTVKYVPSQGATGTTISANDYTLTGVLSEGANAVLVSYGNYKTVVDVTAVDFYNIHRRTISNGLVSLSHGSAGRYNDTLGVSGMALNTRRVACTDRGKQPYISSSTFEDTNIYPIPVPLDATSVSASLTPNTMYCAINIWQFDIATSKYTRLDEAGWNIGENTLNFTSGENLFIAISIKKDSGGTSDFDVEPSELVVEFN